MLLTFLLTYGTITGEITHLKKVSENVWKTDNHPIKALGFATTHDPAWLYVRILSKYGTLSTRSEKLNNGRTVEWYNENNVKGAFVLHDGLRSFVVAQDKADLERRFNRTLNYFKEQYKAVFSPASAVAPTDSYPTEVVSSVITPPSQATVTSLELAEKCPDVETLTVQYDKADESKEQPYVLSRSVRTLVLEGLNFKPGKFAEFRIEGEKLEHVDLTGLNVYEMKSKVVQKFLEDEKIKTIRCRFLALPDDYNDLFTNFNFIGDLTKRTALIEKNKLVKLEDTTSGWECIVNFEKPGFQCTGPFQKITLISLTEDFDIDISGAEVTEIECDQQNQLQINKLTINEEQLDVLKKLKEGDTIKTLIVVRNDGLLEIDMSSIDAKNLYAHAEIKLRA